MPSFDILNAEHPGEDDAVSMTPYWVIAIFRFKYPLTYDHRAGQSFTSEYPESTRLRGAPLIITDHCIQLSVTSTKTSHLISMNATLMPNASVNYLSEFFPGDWMGCWVVNSSAKSDSLIARIKSGERCNNFDDGLKFIGRVDSVHKSIQQNPSGPRIMRYTLTGTGFQEFDASLFYDPQLANNVQAFGYYWSKLDANLTKLLEEHRRGIGVKEAQLFFLDTLLGQGVPRNLGQGGQGAVDPALRSTAGLDSPYAYIIPDSVGRLLGKTEKTKTGGSLSAADIIEFVYGVQSYNSAGEEQRIASSLGASESAVTALAFNPDGTRYGGNRRWTGKDLMGVFQPGISSATFSGKTVWSILSEFLNPAVNEIYTCLRANPDGYVVPTLVTRQLPFSTELAPTEIATTKFLDLPRWIVHPILVKKVDVGRSNSMRWNFVHVYGDPGPIPDAERYNKSQVPLNPPIRDDLDTARSGLRNYSTTVACYHGDIENGGPKLWMRLLSDWLMGQHLSLTGLMEIEGVVSPICPGDNIEWDGVVFHIESVTHTCALSGGPKSFTTTLALTHGVSATPDGTNLGVYAVVGDHNDMRQYEPGLTDESNDSSDHVDPSEPRQQIVEGNDPSSGAA